MKECGHLIGRAKFKVGHVELSIPVYCNKPDSHNVFDEYHAYHDGGLVIRKDKK